METVFEEDMSDDEIFFGKITMKEIKKLLSFRPGPTVKNYDLDSSLRLIRSQPDLRKKIEDSPLLSSPPRSQAFNRKSDESFINMEEMVAKLCDSPRTSTGTVLNNTFEIVNYILKRGRDKKGPGIEENQSKASPVASPIVSLISPKHTPLMEIKETDSTEDIGSPNYYTPANTVIKKPLKKLATPSKASIKLKKTISKTPINHSTLSPGRINAYQHISSPIAAYIKHSPQVPLVKAVHPKKPLPGTSLIPKYVGNKAQIKIQAPKNKENVCLPSVAYKSAKQTKVVELPDKDKLPKSQWVYKMKSTQPRPTIMKHKSRIMNPLKKQLVTNEDSFGNLSSHQAEVSLCTQKTAFKSTNKR